MEHTIENKELTVIDKSLELFRGGSQIIKNHQSRASKALVVAGNILAAWDAAYREPDESVRRGLLAAADKRSNDFLANCGVAKSEMEDSRKAITQLMDVIRKMFTEEEAKMDVKAKDSKPAAIQAKRNQYAKEILEQQERDRKDAEMKAAKDKEEIEIRSYIRSEIGRRLLAYLNTRKAAIQDSFNKITLADFDAKSDSLRGMTTDFPREKLGPTIAYPDPSYFLIDFTAYNSIRISEHNQFDFAAFYADFKVEIEKLKSYLLDRLPAKKEELLDQKRVADEAEAKRQDELRKQQEAEAKRQEELSKAKAADRERMERENEEARKKEADRLADIERRAEESRKEAEAQQKKREEEENMRLANEATAAEKKRQEEIELQRSAAEAEAMFNQTSEAALIEDGPEAKNTVIITVTHPAGIVELFQFWFTRESAKLSIEEMMKKSLAQIKAYAEKTAQKDDVRINSKYLSYSTGVKAVNRKAK